MSMLLPNLPPSHFDKRLSPTGLPIICHPSTGHALNRNTGFSPRKQDIYIKTVQLSYIKQKHVLLKKLYLSKEELLFCYLGSVQEKVTNLSPSNFELYNTSKENEYKQFPVFKIKDVPCTLCAHFGCRVHGF